MQPANEDISIALLDWWSKNKRLFPWRETNNIYHILIAEVLLHRTKAKQVVPVYLEFINSYPTIERLSQATLTDIETKVHSLGLHWRTKLIQDMVKVIVVRFHGKIPENRKELMSLPGVSQYVSSATLCFALNKLEPIIDTNTVRILGRVLNLQITDNSRRSTKFALEYEKVCSKENPRAFAFAMIDLAAIVCLPRKPLCNNCPINKFCMFNLKKTGEEIERKNSL